MSHVSATQGSTRMDIQARLQRKNQQAALRARRMNKTARRLLQDKIEVLESSYKKQEKIMFRQTKTIEYELRSSNKDNAIKIDPQVVTGPSLDLSASTDTTSEYPRGGHPHFGTRCPHHCWFHAVGSQCRYFPCQRISTYHSIGYNIHAPTGSPADHGTSKTYIIQDGMAQDARDFVRNWDIEPPSSRVSPRNSIQDRERGLKQLVREMKQRNNQQRPRAWAINYGDPVSRRQLLKPVIPVSEAELAS